MLAQVVQAGQPVIIGAAAGDAEFLRDVGGAHAVIDLQQVVRFGVAILGMFLWLISNAVSEVSVMSPR